MPTAIDLFAGCGGISWGLAKAGFRVLAGIDFLEAALNTYKVNHPGSRVYHTAIEKLHPESVMADLKLKKGKLDVLVGGPPCQGFSKNVPASGRFFEDPRNLLFRQYLKYVEAMRPKVVVIENVAEIHNAFCGTVREEIQDTLFKLGYSVEAKVLYAPDYGIPQKRRRCFFVAVPKGAKFEFPDAKFSLKGSETLFAVTEKYRSAWDAISDLPKVQNGGGKENAEYPCKPKNDYQAIMRRESEFVTDHVARRLNEKQHSRVKCLKPGEAWKSLPDNLRPKSGFSGAYGRLDFKSLAPTITRWVFHPGSGRYSHPREDRLITIREAARLQSFSDDFKFVGTYIAKAHQIGNAVPPLLMEIIAENIKSSLNGPKALKSSRSKAPVTV